MPEPPTLNVKDTEDGNTVYLVRQLNLLIEEETNFITYYDVIIQKLDDEDVKRELHGFRGQHERHVEELTNAVEELGGAPQRPGRPTLAAETEVGFMQSMDLDADSLLAYLEIGERQSVWLYDAARSIPGLPDGMNDVLESAYRDEQKHHAWVLGRLSPEKQVSARQPPQRPAS